MTMASVSQWFQWVPWAVSTLDATSWICAVRSLSKRPMHPCTNSSILSLADWEWGSNVPKWSSFSSCRLTSEWTKLSVAEVPLSGLRTPDRWVELNWLWMFTIWNQINDICFPAQLFWKDANKNWSYISLWQQVWESMQGNINCEEME